MRPVLAFLAFFLGVTVAHGNFYIPYAKLAGETVHVRMLKDTAEVIGVFAFENFSARGGGVYLPVFAPGPVKTTDLLTSLGVEVEVRDKKTSILIPCAAPEKFRDAAPGHHVYWFKVDLDQLFDDQIIEGDLVIKVRYLQPLIRGRFFYLPVIDFQPKEIELSARAWRYQMHIHSNSRPIDVISNSTDSEKISDGVVVYLENGKIVEAR